MGKKTNCYCCSYHLFPIRQRRIGIKCHQYVLSGILIVVHHSVIALRSGTIHSCTINTNSGGFCFVFLFFCWFLVDFGASVSGYLHTGSLARCKKVTLTLYTAVRFTARLRKADRCFFLCVYENRIYWQTENTFQCMHLPSYSIVRGRTQIYAASHAQMHAAYKSCCTFRAHARTHTHIQCWAFLVEYFC